MANIQAEMKCTIKSTMEHVQGERKKVEKKKSEKFKGLQQELIKKFIAQVEKI